MMSKSTGKTNNRKEIFVKSKTKAVLQAVLLIAGVVMLIYGAYRGEAATILSKAIKLCLECVGIG